MKMDTVTAMDSATTDARLKVNVAPADGVATVGPYRTLQLFPES